MKTMMALLQAKTYTGCGVGEKRPQKVISQ